MYIPYIMKRTQIYLTDEEGEVLRRRRKATGATMSELIRGAIDAQYLRRRTLSREERRRIVRETYGAWKGSRESGETYVDRLRGTRRLTRLHRSS